MGTLDSSKIRVKNIKQSNYQEIWQDMQNFTQKRDADTIDELWVVEHDPIFTLGRNGKEAHILEKSDIPIIKVDRGGQVTYHGPGQLVIYFLLDLHRRNLGIRKLVTLIENSIIKLLAKHNLNAESQPKAPGVYIDGEKIAALGLRVSKGCTTHGLSLNIDMDLSPFSSINPCGYKGLVATQTKDHGIEDTMEVITQDLLSIILEELNAVTLVQNQ